MDATSTARAVGHAARAQSAWSVPSNDAHATRTQGGGEVGAAAAEELSAWLAQELAEQRQALRSALERSRQESQAALDELGRGHEVLAAQLRGRWQAQHAPEAPQCLPGVPSESEPDGLAGLVVTDLSPWPSDTPPHMDHSHMSSTPPQSAAHLAAPGAHDTDKKDVNGQVAARSAESLALDGGSPTVPPSPVPRVSRVSVESLVRASQDVKKRINAVLFREKAHDTWADFVQGSRFEAVMAVFILLNGVQMAFEVQLSGLTRGHDLGYRDYARNPDPWPGAEEILQMVSMFFGAVFTCEVSLKISLLRCRFFKSGWNVFDLFVVLCFLVEVSASTSSSSSSSSVLSEATALRLFRLVRLLRLARVFRTLAGFDTLFLMTTAIQGSVSVLAWSCMFLFIIQALVAFLINQALEEFYFGGDHPQQEQEDVFEYFGSFSRALLSTFEMALANWPPVCRLLMENVSEWYMVVCLLHKVTVGFAVVGVINGVFIQETFRTAAEDDFTMMRQKERTARTHREKMERLMAAGDESGDGCLDKVEFMQLVEHREVKMWLSSMGLDAADGAALFDFIDVDGDGELSAAELIQGVSKLKGTAKSLDMLLCLKRQEEMYRALRDIHPELEQPKKSLFRSERASAVNGDALPTTEDVSFMMCCSHE